MVMEGIRQLVIDENETFMLYLTNHIRICLYAIAISVSLGIILGIISAKNLKAGTIIVNTANFLNLIPTIALLILAMPILGSGTVPALTAMCIGCTPVIIINTRMGILNVEPQIIEAAKGMGMDPYTCLFKIELPLAIPLIFAGIRIAMIQAISAATIASYIGSNSLGNYIVTGFYGGKRSVHKLLVGAGTIVILTVLIDGIMSLIQKWCNKRYNMS